MSQPLSLQQVTERLIQLEQLLDSMREELAELRRETKASSQSQQTETQSNITYLWVDKELQKHWLVRLFDALSIQGEPIGAEAFQQKMKQAGLTPDELSRSLIEMREQ